MFSLTNFLVRPSTSFFCEAPEFVFLILLTVKRTPPLQQFSWSDLQPPLLMGASEVYLTNSAPFLKLMEGHSLPSSPYGRTSNLHLLWGSRSFIRCICFSRAPTMPGSGWVSEIQPRVLLVSGTGLPTA